LNFLEREKKKGGGEIMSSRIIDEEWLREKEVAKWTKRALGTLRNDRYLGRGFPYTRVGRAVFYSRRAIEEYMKKHTISHD